MTSRPDEYSAEYSAPPPCDVEAERAVLGAMLLSPMAIADVVERLTGRDFYEPAHTLVYDAIVDLYAAGAPVDPVTVKAELLRRGQIGQAGGAPYLHTLVHNALTAASAGYHAGLVAEHALRRRLIEAGVRIVQLARAPGTDPDEILDRAEDALYHVDADTRGSEILPLGADYTAAWQRYEALAAGELEQIGIPTGLPELDRLLGGLRPGCLYLIAGRPSMGKSCLALDWARQAALRHGLPAVIFSLEMSRDELVNRQLAAEAGIPLDRLSKGKMSREQWIALADTMGETANAPLFVDADPNITIPVLRAKARRLVQRHGVRFIGVDYLQLMTAGGRRYENREKEVAEISRALKLLGKELEVPVVAVCQLNREPEKRADRRPQLADLRESGAQEQDADAVILLYRPDYYDKAVRPGEAELIVAKNRNGETGTAHAAWQGRYQRFVPLHPDERPPSNGPDQLDWSDQ